MSFDVAAEAYDRFMGRYSRQLSGQLAEPEEDDPAHHHERREAQLQGEVQR